MLNIKLEKAAISKNEDGTYKVVYPISDKTYMVFPRLDITYSITRPANEKDLTFELHEIVGTVEEPKPKRKWFQKRRKKNG